MLCFKDIRNKSLTAEASALLRILAEKYIILIWDKCFSNIVQINNNLEVKL